MNRRPSPLALAVLALVGEEPMHPYRMRQLITRRGKDEVINVRQRANLYKTIDRLHRDGLIRVREVARDERRPERTVYEATDRGRAAARSWLAELLGTPPREFPEFPAALALLPVLPPDRVLAELDSRAERLTAELTRIDGELRGHADLPRLFLLEMEFLRGTVEFELRWVRSLADDLRAGRLHWTDDWLRELARARDD